MTGAYRPLREARDLALPVRGLTYHVNAWGDASLATPERPPLLMLHGWMDVGASFQFVVDALARTEGARRYVLAPDWRGFGGTSNGGSDSYWFPDYLGDLDALADALAPGQPFDLLGHSMGGNVVMSYAGIRPGRIRRLVNLEGFGLPDMSADRAPERAAKWLDELKTPQAFSPYADAQAVAARLRKNNPRLPADKAAWLATHWAEPRADGQWHLRADPAHRRTGPPKRWRPGVPSRRRCCGSKARRPTCASGGATAIRGPTSTPAWRRCAVCRASRWKTPATCCITTSPRRWRLRWRAS
jgi:pimeloyl-ACP methyl ester carboxylesterase